MNPISLGMAKRSSAADRGHPFPAPAWWLVAIGRVRDAMTDQDMLDAIEQQTGRRYSKFTLSRYFKAEDPTTTLELTLDLWRTFGTQHGIPQPVVVAATRAEAERLTHRRGDALDESFDRFEAELQKDAAASHPPVLLSPRGEKQRSGSEAGARGVAAGRRRH